MRNIELKARLHDRARAEAACAALEAAHQGDIHQIDTYFRVPEGRLKLREATPGRTELVFYHRPDVAGPKGCEYTLETVQPSIKPLLSDALGVLAIVDKLRTLYLWHNVRIHLDCVKDLGDFLEFEAVLSAEFDDADGFRKLERLIAEFHLAPEDHLETSYLEMTLKQRPPRPFGP
ncbi:MAG: class IV adenylate cyclase [Candidatus Hydrogenedentes bacterium]|nr:class IV adenylate cyclase [Candidatus Hydrogenedentota bacterium]MBI3117696.1 class IV adenylate cyclase [Candidatus Hydrogenedentota bacterium]